ncbi:MAG: DUF4097 family beta strand repeat protein [Clostridia bacterium]|nr:DUF4097 family beta strand repeat protein [Clostridia bacterium]
MGKKIRIWLIVAVSLILVGGIVFTVAMSSLGWDFAKLSTAKHQTSKHTVSETFDGVSIYAQEADIRLAIAENGECRVECFEKESVPHTVKVENGKLIIAAVDNSKWYENILNFAQETITVYLPQREYTLLSIRNLTGDVEVSKDFSFESVQVSTITGDIRCFASASGGIELNTTTGDILIENISVSSLRLTVSTGQVRAMGVNCTDGVNVEVSTGGVYLTNVACKSLVSSGSTGDIALNNVQATERLSIERDTGDVRFEGCDGGEIVVKTGTGDVSGTLLTAKTFLVETSTGRVDVPQSSSGGKCQIKTGTGDIYIRVLG